jgi:hypothetical protein
VPQINIPINPVLCGEFMREPLLGSLLSPKTHKLAGGQLAILPSRSVLVDFREGERRKGRKGEEAIVVSPNGDQVSLFFLTSRNDSESSKIHLFNAWPRHGLVDVTRPGHSVRYACISQQSCFHARRVLRRGSMSSKSSDMYNSFPSGSLLNGTQVDR